MSISARILTKFVVLAALSLCLAVNCRAVELTINATAVGNIRRVPGATIQHSPMSTYRAGSQGNGVFQIEENNYFVFDLTSVAGTIVGAEFRVYTSNERADFTEGGYWSSSDSEEFQLREVTTNPATLMNFSTTQYNSPTPQFSQLDAMFTDLENGSLFGSTVITEAAAEVEPGVVPGQPGGKIWSIPLSSFAVNSLNTATDLWAIGGSLADTAAPISTTTEFLFYGSLPFTEVPGRATPIPQLVLTMHPGLSADFDGDGHVDGRDFLIWQRGFGLSGQTNNGQGDASGNGSVDGNDLLLWQAQYNTALLVSTITSVPEPSFFVLAAPLFSAVFSRRRKS
jgi:hypothetical protein